MTSRIYTEDLFVDGSAFFNELINDINNAKNSIDLEIYIFKGDKLGEKVANALINAAKRNVKVRVLVDGAGTPVWGGSMTRRLERAGVETRIFHPFPWRVWHWSRSVIRLPLLLKLIYLLLKINSRNHRKVCIIDQDIVYIGSFNISKCHLKIEDGGAGWRDTGVRLQHVNLSDLQTAFHAAWTQIPIHERLQVIFRNINKNPIFRLNNSWHRRRILYKNLLRRMSKCRQRIWVTNAYFVPDNFLLKKLKEAAQRGKDVRILLPKKSDVFVMPWASTTFYYTLLKSGVRIFEYAPNILHAKTLILDNWITIGSSNLNHRSLLHDLEVDVNLQLQASKKRILEQFKEDLNNAKEISLKNWSPRPLYQRIIGRFALYMKYWI
ncbi:MAG: phospholipase D-like domain-containing protein [Pseudomonadota bacterium]|nr:phospholipase D-like domain-containing protein [Pseudomonadota bacterium]